MINKTVVGGTVHKTTAPRRTLGLTARAAMVALLSPAIVVTAASAYQTPTTQADRDQRTVTRTVLDEDWVWVATSNGWALPLEYLGWGTAITLTNDDPVLDFEIPHSRGHQLQSFEFSVTAADHVESLDLILAIDEAEVWTKTIDGRENNDIVIDFGALRTAVTAGQTISLSATPAFDDACPVGERPQLARLTTPTLFFAVEPTEMQATSPTAATPNTETATPGLQSPEAMTTIHFEVDDGRSAAVDQAVLDAATRLASAFPGTQRTSVVNEADLEQRSPFAFTMAIEERDAASIEVIDAGAILITGRGDQLRTQAHGLTESIQALSSLEDLVIASEEPVVAVLPFVDGSVLLTDIPGTRVADAGAKQLEVLVPLDQPSFGQPVSSFYLRLGGVVSPADSADLGSSQLSLWVDDTLVEILSPEDNGRFDLEIDVEGDLLQRNSVVRLRFDGPAETCLQPGMYTLQLDPASWLEPTFGQSLEPGLHRFPQASAGGLAVMTGRETWQLGVATETLTLLQEGSTVPLRTSVISAEQARDDDRPMLIVGADVELHDALRTPINNQLGRVETGSVHINVADGLDYPFVLQGFVGPNENDIVSVDAIPHDGAGGLPDKLSNQGLELFNGAAVTVDHNGEVVQVAGRQQLREEAAPNLLGQSPSHEGPTTAIAIRRSLAAGIALSLFGAFIVLATRPLRRSRLGSN